MKTLAPRTLPLLLLAGFGIAHAATPLDPRTLSKFVDPLPILNVMPPADTTGSNYAVGMWQITQKLHRDLPATTVWAYGPSKKQASYPAPTIEAQKGKQITVKWTNNLPTTHLLSGAVDKSIHGADKGVPDVRTVVHLHGADVAAASDGFPEDWFTSNPAALPNGLGGPAGNSATYTYPNQQEPTTLWYHDHALGLTRLNVYAGLAGFYLIRDPVAEKALNLPQGPYEIPLMIQDKLFLSDGSLNYPTPGVNPDVHPQWQPEQFGDTILVNGKIWPYLNVEPRKYRFRVLNASNARMYNLSISGPRGVLVPPISQIGSDGGYLSTPAPLTNLFIAPAERADLVVDFSSLKPGTVLSLTNDAKAPYPSGTPADPQTVGQIMQFRVVAPKAADNSTLPAKLADIPAPQQPLTVRRLTLNEIEGAGGPLMGLLDNAMWDHPISETPASTTTEMWEFINLTADTHPVHLHLVHFRLVDRQRFNVTAYLQDYNSANANVTPGMGGTVPAVDPYLQGSPMLADANESGWKDVIKMNPGEVTRIIARWAPTNGSAYPFDPTKGLYVTHCHILEHEDNEMMRPWQVTP